MGRRSLDITGQTYGLWTVRRLATAVEAATVGTVSGRVWWCRCECGTEKPVSANSLRRGQSTRCRGCAAPLALSRLVVGRRAAVPDHSDRDSRIRQLRSQGWTLARIAADVGLSTERVRKILATTHGGRR